MGNFFPRGKNPPPESGAEVLWEFRARWMEKLHNEPSPRPHISSLYFLAGRVDKYAESSVGNGAAAWPPRGGGGRQAGAPPPAPAVEEAWGGPPSAADSSA